MAPSTTAGRELSGARIAVVGATGALGSLVAAELERRGARLLVVGRDADRLASLGTGVPVVADLGDAGAGDAVVAAAREHLGGLDGLVNAAGVVAFGALVDTPDEVVEELFLTNVLGPLFLLRRVVPLLEESQGFVLQISAVVAERPMPRMAAYSASKAALSAVAIALRTELRRSRVDVYDVRPPHTETGLASRPLAGEAPRPARRSRIRPTSPGASSTRSLRASRTSPPTRSTSPRGAPREPGRPGTLAPPGRRGAPGLPADRRPGRLSRPRRGGRRPLDRRPRAALAPDHPGRRRCLPATRAAARLDGRRRGRDDVGTWVAVVGGLLAVATTAAVAAPTHGRLSSAPPGDRPALLRRLDRADRVRSLGAVVCAAGALALVARDGSGLAAEGLRRVHGLPVSRRARTTRR